MKNVFIDSDSDIRRKKKTGLILLIWCFLSQIYKWNEWIFLLPIDPQIAQTLKISEYSTEYPKVISSL